MVEARACIGVDVGTSSLKGVAVAPDGRLLAEASASYPLWLGAGGRAEQEPDWWWEAAQQVLSELGASSALGIGLSGQMHGAVLLDSRQRVIRPAILWNDSRAASEAAELEARLGGPRVPLEIAGTRAMAGLTAPKLLWMSRHEPELLARARHLLLPKDEVRRRLCGEIATDAGDASGTFLFDTRTRSWSTELVEAAGVDPAILPAVGEAVELAGESDAGVPVALGSGDQPCGAVGIGAVGEGIVSLVLGTSGVALTPRRGPGAREDSDAWTHTFCHALPGWWYRMGVSLCAGGSLRWLQDAIAATSTPIAALIEEASKWQPGAGGLCFLPYLSGERTPIGRADARGSFVGLALMHDRGALVRAVLEGVAFALRDCFDAVVEGDGEEVEEIRVSGGGADSDLWLEIIASVLERPVTVCGSNAGAAFGAAILGGIAAGVWESAETAPIPEFARTIEPASAWIEPYQEGLARFRHLRETLVPSTDLPPASSASLQEPGG